MENEQLNLFSLNYAESGNTNQLLPVPGDEPLTGERNTDGCFLFLPAAGNRNNTNGSGTTATNNAGSNGNYWSKEENSSNNGYNLNFNSGNANTNNNNKTSGFSVRCVQAFTVSEVPSFFPYKNQLT